MEKIEHLLDRRQAIIWLLEQPKTTEAQKIILLETLQIINEVITSIEHKGDG